MSDDIAPIDLLRIQGFLRPERPEHSGVYWAVPVLVPAHSTGLVVVMVYLKDGELRCRTVSRGGGGYDERDFDEFALWSRRINTGLLDEMRVISRDHA